MIYKTHYIVWNRSIKFIKSAKRLVRFRLWMTRPQLRVKNN